MPKKAPSHWPELIAKQVAAGLSMKEAGTKVGYAPTSNSYFWLKHDPKFQRMVERFRRQREWAGIGDLGDVVGSLLKKSLKTQKDTAGQNLSRLCLVSAAQFILKLPETPGEGDDTRRRADDSRRSADDSKRALDEWAATYGVK